MNAPANLPTSADSEVTDAPDQAKSKFRAVMAYSSPVVDLAFMLAIVAIIGVSMLIGGLINY